MVWSLARVVAGALLTVSLVACTPPGGGVTPGVTDVAIPGGDRSVALGSTVTLTATVTTTGGAGTGVSWASSQQGVATIDGTGSVTTLSVGTTTITATSTADPTKQATITLTVAAVSGVLGVTIDGGDRSIVFGDSLTLTATVSTVGGVGTGVTWSSSNHAVAAVGPTGSVTIVSAGTTTITATSTVDPTKQATITLTVTPPGVLIWTRQFGTSASDVAEGVATDAAGHVYTAGFTRGALEGTNAGASDAFVRSYDAAGNVRWTRQFGTGSSDGAHGVAADSDGNVYATGYTDGVLEGDSAGTPDAFLRSYDRDGNHRWTRQFGTANAELAFAVATDADGNVYTAGFTNGALAGPHAGGGDGFVRSYDRDGNDRWTRQFGTSDLDTVFGIATDANGHVFVVGYTHGDLSGTLAGVSDAFVRSYDRDGNHRWTRQFGTGAADNASGVATDGDGNVYVAGNTRGALGGIHAGGMDAFVRSYDGNGNLRWARQFGTAGADLAKTIATDAHGNLFVAGYTSGALDGTNAGSDDAFLRSYDANGNLRWAHQFGTGASDEVNGVATDASGSVYVAGYTEGALASANLGNSDAFIRKYGP